MRKREGGRALVSPSPSICSQTTCQYIHAFFQFDLWINPTAAHIPLYAPPHPPVAHEEDVVKFLFKEKDAEPLYSLTQSCRAMSSSSVMFRGLCIFHIFTQIKWLLLTNANIFLTNMSATLVH